MSIVDCKWSPWTQWDLCTRSCGGGMQGRTRSILVPERNGGKRCDGEPAPFQFVRIVPDMQLFAQLGPTFVPTVHLFKDVAEKHVIFVKQVLIIISRSTNT